MTEPDASLESIRQRLGELVELRFEQGLTNSQRDEYLDLVALEAEVLERNRQR